MSYFTNWYGVSKNDLCKSRLQDNPQVGLPFSCSESRTSRRKSVPQYQSQIIMERVILLNNYSAARKPNQELI